jgi:DNA-binding NarL/FixJ family response regulator
LLEEDRFVETKSRIVIAEDHTILREGLRVLLSSHPDLEVVGEAVDGREAVRRVEEEAPDLVLLDLSMPRMDGMDAIREIRKGSPETKILALTVHKAEEYVLSALQAGADGYALKDATHAELVTAIRSVLAGKRYLSPGVSEQVIEGYLAGKRGGEPKSTWASVTPREREVLKLIAEGYKNKEISEVLCISVKTVEKHRSNIMEKLDLHNASDLTAYAIERGIVTR